MKRSSPLLIGILTLTVIACTPSDNQSTDDNASSSEASSVVEETRNVLYRGRLEEAGATIFMQGTHRLVLDDDRFVMLESEAVNLDRYVGQQVEVFGSVRPTAEQGGMIMRVESVRSLESSSSSSMDVSGMSSAESSAASMDSMTISSTAASTASTAASSAAAVTSSAQAFSSVAPPVTTSSTAAMDMDWEASSELTAKAETMAKVKIGPENWTQQYCSTHIGFCMPVHKNWWFKSFGATTTALWHLEIGPSEMNNLGEGPITVRLVTGNVDASADGQVQVSNGEVLGMRTWTGNRHFEVRGPANLEAAVRYITEQIKAAEQ